MEYAVNGYHKQCTDWWQSLRDVILVDISCKKGGQLPRHKMTHRLSGFVVVLTKVPQYLFYARY